MVRNLHRNISGRASRRRALDSEVLSARKNEPKLVRVVSDDTAFPRVGVGCVIAIEREKINPALRDVTARRNQFHLVRAGQQCEYTTACWEKNRLTTVHFYYNYEALLLICITYEHARRILDWDYLVCEATYPHFRAYSCEDLLKKGRTEC